MVQLFGGTSLIDLLDAMIDNYKLYYNDQWMATVRSTIAECRQYDKQLREESPPASLRDVHNQFLVAVDHDETAMQYISQWLDEPNSTELLELSNST